MGGLVLDASIIIFERWPFHRPLDRASAIPFMKRSAVFTVKLIFSVMKMVVADKNDFSISSFPQSYSRLASVLSLTQMESAGGLNLDSFLENLKAPVMMTMVLKTINIKLSINSSKLKINVVNLTKK